MNAYYDDGNWNWNYECIYATDTNNPNDYHYGISFEITYGDIDCYYYKSKNRLELHRCGVSINFFVENFYDIKKILIPMIKENDANPYSINISKRVIRKEKLKLLSNLI